MSQPKVSIIILNWNGLEDTIECLESLKKITYSNYEVIVVDNASEGNDVEILREKFRDYIHVIENNKNYGFPEGNNIGMRYALNKGADYVLLLNNDTVVDPEFLSELLKVAESDKTIGILGSKIYYYDYPNRIQAVGGRIWWWVGHLKTYGGEEDRGQYDEVADRDFVHANSMLIKREVMEKISLLDPYFFYGVEEFDYCPRAKKEGFRTVYIPQSKIWHKGGASGAKLIHYPETLDLITRKGGFLNYKYNYRLFREHLPPPLFIIPFLYKTLITLPKGLVILILRGDFQTIINGLRKRAVRHRVLIRRRLFRR